MTTTRLRAPVLAALSALSLFGCATAPPLPRETGEGAFVIEQDLLGRTTARGEFRAINGVRRGFTVALNGSFDGTVFTLEEDFVYDDGERDRKTWRLTPLGGGRYSGTREDVIGEAVGVQDGNAFRLEYDVRLPSENGDGLVVRFRDVMVETADGAVLNRASVGWWIFQVAQVELRITR